MAWCVIGPRGGVAGGSTLAIEVRDASSLDTAFPDVDHTLVVE